MKNSHKLQKKCVVSVHVIWLLFQSPSILFALLLQSCWLPCCLVDLHGSHLKNFAVVFHFTWNTTLPGILLFPFSPGLCIDSSVYFCLCPLLECKHQKGLFRSPLYHWCLEYNSGLINIYWISRGITSGLITWYWFSKEVPSLCHTVRSSIANQ